MKNFLLLLFFTTVLIQAQSTSFYPDENPNVYTFEDDQLNISGVFYNLMNNSGSFSSEVRTASSSTQSYKLTTLDDSDENSGNSAWFNLNQGKWVDAKRAETLKISVWIKPFTNSVGKKISIGIGNKDESNGYAAQYPQLNYTLLEGWNLYETYISVEETASFGVRLIMQKSDFVTPTQPTDGSGNYGIYIDDINIESNTVINAGFEEGKFAGDSNTSSAIWQVNNADSSLEFVDTEKYSGFKSAKITAPNNKWRAISPKTSFQLARKTYYGGATFNSFIKSNPVYDGTKANSGSASESLLDDDLYIRGTARVKAETTAHVRMYFNITFVDSNGDTQYENIEDGAATVVNSGDGWVKLDTEDVRVSNAHASGKLNDLVSISKIQMFVQSVKQGSTADGSNIVFYVDDVELNYSTTNPTTLSNNVFSAEAFSLYPNPVTDVLNIQVEKVVDSVAIYNVLGQLVKEIKPNVSSSSLDVSDLASGLYVVKVSANGQNKSFKIVKS